MREQNKLRKEDVRNVKQLDSSEFANVLDTWNDKMAEIWHLITQSSQTFKGGGIWNVVVTIHGALQAIAYTRPFQNPLFTITVRVK